ncbi:MAG: toll/interleukin-1 receptor domain-containing protein [Chitinophagaceae bacterium]|nr:toll/interleukin-1 receptor domain-containing protein [Chitinophagaceae bacterium]
MHTKYQLILIGADHSLKPHISSTFIARVNELGIAETSITILDENNFTAQYKKNCPTVALYFGTTASFPNEDTVTELIADAAFILPVVSDLKQVSDLLPEKLRILNAFEFGGIDKTESLVARIMEALSLLRAARRLFISYRRVESRSVAIQLYEYLDQCGFDVFLDTHSIRPGEPFQDELWHRLVDTDVVILLDTPGFLKSEWTEQELAKASAMSIGVFQIVWPDHFQEPYSTLCFPLYLKKSNFELLDFKSASAHLSNNTLSLIGSEVESLRARSLAARQDNLIQEFTSTAKALKIISHLQPEKFITMIRSSNGEEISIIPTVGVPQAFNYNQSEELIKRIRANKSTVVYLLYDHRNIMVKWQTHLTWLDKHLPVKALKITEIESWMKTL